MHDVALLATLAGGLTAALALGYVTERLHLSPIVGYLLAGLLVGPYTPGFVADSHLASQLAEVGVILLMFGVGLQFHLDELLAVRRVAVPGAVVQSAIATGLGAAGAHLLGWAWPAAIVFGLSLAVASTVVLVRVLSDNRQLHTPTGHVAVGWLVVEDIFTVIVLVVLPSLASAGASVTSLGPAIALTLAKVAGLAGFTFVVGTRAIPWLLDRVSATRSRELFTLTVLVIALGIAVGSAAVFGVSMALGAFLAGMVVGRSDYSLRAATEALPMRDAFAVLFFVSVGMLLDPRAVLQSPALVTCALIVVLVGKPVAAIAVVLLMRYPMRVALAVGVALAQIGEFSFILAALAQQLGLLPAEAMNTIVATSIVSIVLNPLLYRLLPSFGAAPSLGSAPAAKPAAVPTSSPAHRAVVVGYGPTGRALTRLLRANGIEPTVIELNMDTVRALREEGIAAVYGEAARGDVLQQAGVATAGNLVVTADTGDSREIIRLARALNPSIHVLARTAHLRDVQALRDTGAQGVFSGEGEVALALTEALLHRLGATADQIDRERERARADLTR
jgi:CPA2 family monovalent cation:H+ antiporter-2